MILSMTGYAAASRDLGRALLACEVRSVNSRFLDVFFRMPDELRAVEPQLRELIGAKLRRGKVECRVSLQQVASGARAQAADAAMLAQLRVLQDQVQSALPQAAPLTVADALRWPGVLADEAIPPETLHAQCVTLARGVLEEMVVSRAREGGKLAGMILERVGRMRELVAEVAPRLPQQISDYQERLSAKLREACASLDEERIRQEVGVFAMRIDVAEELSRLSTHLDEVARTLDQGGAAGKRLDFLMQELNREANTLSSKSVSTEVTRIALELKLLTEQMREQVQNIE